MKFGKIKHVIILGGGQLSSEFIGILKKEKLLITVVTSQRHAQEMVMVQARAMSYEKFLADNKIEFFVSKDINQDGKVISKITDQTMGISLGAAWILKEHFIQRFKGRLINCHGTRLPEDRGGGGFSWRIMRKNRQGSSLFHKLEVGIDTGDIVACRKFVYPVSCRTSLDYQDVYIRQTVSFFKDFLKGIKANKNFNCVAQNESVSTYWPRLATTVHGFVDWQWSLGDIESFICAFDDPYCGATTFINGQKVRLKKVSVHLIDGAFHPFQRGIVYRKRDGMLYVAAHEGTLLIKQVIDEEGKDVMSGIREGDRFYTPIEFLENAQKARVFYTPQGLKGT